MCPLSRLRERAGVRGNLALALVAFRRLDLSRFTGEANHRPVFTLVQARVTMRCERSS